MCYMWSQNRKHSGYLAGVHLITDQILLLLPEIEQFKVTIIIFHDGSLQRRHLPSSSLFRLACCTCSSSTPRPASRLTRTGTRMWETTWRWSSTGVPFFLSTHTNKDRREGKGRCYYLGDVLECRNNFAELCLRD